MAIISFENLVVDDMSFLAEIPDGFRKLNWYGFLAVETERFPPDSSIRDSIHSGSGYAINGLGGKPAGFKSPDRDNDFDLNSGYFTAAAENNLQVKIVGFDDGKKVATKVLSLEADQENADQEFIRFGPQFDGIDEVKFTVIGGTNSDPSDFQPIFGVDDLFLNL